MQYYITKTLNTSFEEALEITRKAIEAENFGILCEIDVQENLRKKLDTDFYKYKIIGACNSRFAYKALQEENKIGTMLPCSFIVQEAKPGNVEVSVINPTVAMKPVGNPALAEVAAEVEKSLHRIIDSIN